jgi:hypothetical protein
LCSNRELTEIHVAEGCKKIISLAWNAFAKLQLKNVKRRDFNESVFLLSLNKFEIFSHRARVSLNPSAETALTK